MDSSLEENINIREQNNCSASANVEHESIFIKNEPFDPTDINSSAAITQINLKTEPDEVETMEFYEKKITNDRLYSPQDMCKTERVNETSNKINLTKEYSTDVMKSEDQNASCLGKSITKIEHVQTCKMEQTCNICSEIFEDNTELEYHMLTHSEIKPVIEKSISANTLNHDSEKIHVCAVCNKGFTQRSQLYRHRLIHSDKKRYPCNICNSKFRHKSDLVKHQRIHTGDKPYVCNFCEKAFARKDYLAKHVRLHTKETPYSCQNCSKSFIRKSDLNAHLKTHKNPSENSVKLETKPSEIPTNLIKTEDESNLNNLDEKSVMKIKLNGLVEKNSVKNSDLKKKKYSCNECSKTFVSKSNLNTHMKIHSNIKSYVCEICEISFYQKSSLELHAHTHTGTKPYGCDICMKSFTSKHNLKQHKLIHSGVKPYECELCNKKYRCKSELTIHKRSHSGEKPYVCDICNKSFVQKSNLTHHKFTHIDDKPYACDDCGKTFAQKIHLFDHRSVHTKEKPYSCNMCSKSFTQRNVLTKHKQLMHVNQVS